MEKKKILIVDDLHLERKELICMLKKFGHECIEATNGVEALTLLSQQANEIKLILMKLDLPLINGIETADFIFKNFDEEVQHIPIIGTTHREYDFFFDISDTHLTDLIIKPYNEDSINNIICKYTESHVSFKI